MVLGSGIRDPRSGIRKKPIPDPGSRDQKAPDPGSRIPDPDPQHCICLLKHYEMSFCPPPLPVLYYRPNSLFHLEETSQRLRQLFIVKNIK